MAKVFAAMALAIGLAISSGIGATAIAGHAQGCDNMADNPVKDFYC